MGSSISAAREALYGLLSAATYPASPVPLRTVQVTYGPPAAHEGPEVVALLGVQNPDEEPRQLGVVGNRREVYWLEIGVKVHDRAPAGADEAAKARLVDARGFALADVVRNISGLSADNLNLGGAVRTCQPISQTTDGVQPAEGGGWVIFIRVIFECKADITSP